MSAPPLTETVVLAARSAAELKRAQQRRAMLAGSEVPVVVSRLAHGIATLRALDEGRFGSVDEAAEAAGVQLACMRRLVSLALLAPDIQREVLALRPGLVAQRVTVKALAAVAERVSWAAQRRLWARLRETAGVRAAVVNGAARGRRGR